MIAAPVEHVPVLAEKAIELLNVQPGGIYVDCTVGLGGHAERILQEMEDRGRLIALDRDRDALEMSRDRLSAYLHLVAFHHENFKNLPLVLSNSQIVSIDGCLVDLGVSSHQLDSSNRGFSFREDGPLDMRMDSEQRLRAEDLVNRLSVEELSTVFRDYGEERSARRIAKAIVTKRQEGGLHSTLELAELIKSIKGVRSHRVHPATRVFQALRIKVNQELEALDTFLSESISQLKPGARLVVISFHSLEDRIVKKTFQLEAGRCICFKPRELCSCPRVHNVEILTRKPVTPSEDEVSQNPRSRSAKLRAVERVTGSSNRNGAENGGFESPEN